MRKYKKGAADLIAIIISIVVVGALAIAVMTYYSTTAKKSASNGISKVTSGMDNLINTNIDPIV